MDAVDQLLLEKTENLEKMAKIRAQLSAAKAEVMDGGEYSDPKWFAAANTALRYAGKRDQELAAELAKLKRERQGNSRQLRAADFAQNFVDIAKLKLTGRTVQRDQGSGSRYDGYVMTGRERCRIRHTKRVHRPLERVLGARASDDATNISSHSLATAMTVSTPSREK